MANSIRLAALVFFMFAIARASAQDWPQWRGPNRDSKVVGFKAPANWPKELTQKWRKTVGDGVSSPVLAGGKVYVFSRIDGDEVTSCLSADTGEQLWQDKLATPKVPIPAAGFVKGEFAGTRSTPAVGEGKVCTLGTSGAVSCLDAATGKVIWRKETERPQFYTSSSPIIAGGKCIVFVGKLTAFDLADGSVTWTWPDEKDSTPYGSPVLMTVDGVTQVVTPSLGAVAGVALKDGKLLWKFDFGGTQYQSTYATPIIDGQTVIYSAPAGKAKTLTASVAYRIEKKGDEFIPTEVWKSGVSAYQYNTPVLKDGFLYGLSTATTFFCMDAKTGKEIWKDSVKRGQAGGILSAGSTILALTEKTGLVVFEPTSEGYREIANYTVAAIPGYSYPIIAGNHVYVKGEKDLTLWTIE